MPSSMLENLPNFLTYSRILAIPLIIAIFYYPRPWTDWAAFGIFVAAAITDYFDGKLARAWHVTSMLGRLLDPIADKMLVTAVLFMLASNKRLNGTALIPAVVILLREVLISGLREFLASINARGVPVTWLAKWKTAIQMVAISFLILGPSGTRATGDRVNFTLIGVSGIWVAAALTLVTGWGYLREGVRQAGAVDRK
ncbi:putative CDP-diacylglycerol--glycerol-3-phosphate 3-phosphatidyltransferase [Paratrimastix pyriformis]|uniref:CDP-diacylglycerol--glycerol-3-phosphate 3-phosphatidyltransferase n=1 Tax=Paratrimastix pyriformis TaxID=342808 RepID=A0ABQ8UU33_9EUKA|nr:putative CDP-diacylglycerol--glycerol-3-phosphate 3-phosphatidyltransferase [Paratrimastix pyriformis]|eukprot:GAFH01004639.1.p1 GENE.GAFH01004639.1~~GAFH01004639.1.p1  ORF type:complete len:198 (-),score=7.36 GAFH01004639.1:127-720(-)